MPTVPKGIVLDARRTRLEPPDDLAPSAKAIFRRLVHSVAPEHFCEVDAPLLAQYSVSCDMANVAATEIAENGAVIDGRTSPWVTVHEKASRAMVALSARLRVCPQSRFDRTIAGPNARHQPHSKPWDKDPHDEFFETASRTGKK